MKNSVYVAIMATVAAMGGLLFGFDTGVISGAIPFLQRDFGISDSQVELLTTMGLLGAVFGALVSGNITEKARDSQRGRYFFGRCAVGRSRPGYRTADGRQVPAGHRNRDSFVFSPSLHRGNISGQKQGRPRVPVPADDYSRHSGFLSFGPGLCR